MYGLCPVKYDQKFSLKSLSVDCNVRNLLTACTCEFLYKNDGNEDGEGLFSFPLEYNCVVYYLEALVGGKTIIGVCKEVEEAKNLYEAAKEKGHMAAMIEQNTSMMDVFKCRIGNFPKNSEAKIILKFAMELRLSPVRSEIEGVDRFDLLLPLILRPRYTPPGYEGDNEVFAVENKYEYHFTANLKGSKVISNISSINHVLQMEYTSEDKTSAEVNLKSKFDGTKDLDINISYKEMREPSVFYELGTESDHFKGQKVDGIFYKSDVAMVNFLPKYDSLEPRNQRKLEIVFVVDRSGSMTGSNIDRAKECLLIFLKSLPVECKFQIYGFGSNFDKAFNDSQLYSDESINLALNYQRNLSADFGGTELMRPLQDMYNSPLTSDYNRLAFVLTDGDVGNQDEVTNLVRKHNKSTRLFAVGIGDGVSTSLVDKVAKAGLGKSVFVRNAKELSASVMELLDIAINSIPFTDAKLEWHCPPHVSIVTAPKSIPPIFSDYFLTAFCMINGMKSGDVIKCTLSGNVNGNPISIAMDIQDTNAFVDEEFRVHRLLGKYKINEMAEQIENGEESLKKDLIDLSLQVNIVTKYTTFVAIDQEAPDKPLVTCITDDLAFDGVAYCAMAYSMAAPTMASRCMMMSDPAPNFQILGNVPPPPPPMRNLAGNSNYTACRMASRPAPPPPPPSFAREYGEHEFYNSDDVLDNSDNLNVVCYDSEEALFDSDNLNEAYGCFDSVDGYMETKSMPKIETKEVKQDVIMFLVDQQNINGSWNYDEKIFTFIGVDTFKLKAIKSDQISDIIWSTIVIYQYLVIKEQSREKEWRLFARKAKEWVERNLKDSEMFNNSLKKIAELFQ